MSELIKIENLNKKFNNLTILEDVSISFKNKGIYGIKGESGSGKSTLLFILGLLDNDYEGNIFYKGKNYKSIQNKAKFINENIGYVFQNPIFFSNLTIKENLSLATCEDEQNINYLLRRLNINASLNHKVSSLSGGEKLRLSLVRALKNNPEILLCDEPSASLDEENAKIVFNILKEESFKRTVIIVSHDEELLSNYSNYIYKLEDKKLKLIKNINHIDEENFKTIKKNKINNQLSINFIFNYLKATYLKKKSKTILCLFSLLISFFTIGFSFVLTYDVSNSIKNSFSTLMDNNQIILKSYNSEDSLEKISITEESAKDIIYESNYFYDYGYLYSANFETQFKDKNYLSLKLDDKELSFFDVGLRSIAESILLDDIPKDVDIYPYNKLNLSYDEGILGLRRRDIKKICQFLNLENHNQEALGEYLKTSYLDFCFYFENSSWGYSNEVLFRLRGFFISEEKIIVCHNDKEYVKDFFEVKMKLPTSDNLNSTDYYPWTIKKAIYLRTKKEEEALKEYFKSHYYEDYDLNSLKENLASDFLLSKYHRGKYIVTYSCNKKISYQSLERLIKEKHIKDVFPTFEAYPVLEDALVSGFSNTVFVFYVEETSDEIEYYYDEINTNIDTLNPLDVSFSYPFCTGNLITSAYQTGLKLTTNIDGEIYGRLPSNINEVMISSKIAKKLFSSYEEALNKNIFLMINQYSMDTGNTFIKNKINISGIFESDKEEIFQEVYWYPLYLTLKINYPIEKININTFLCKNILSEDELNGIYTEKYVFSNPLKSVYDSVDNVLNMIHELLNVFLILLFLSSLGILFVTIQSAMKEASKEIGLLKSIGISKFSIFKLYLTYGTSYSLICLILSSFLLFLISKVITVLYFNEAFSFVVNPSPFIYMWFIGLTICLPLSIIETLLPLIKKPTELLKRYY